MSRYEVIVGNVGTVYDGDSPEDAGRTFAMYKRDSMEGITIREGRVDCSGCRTAGERVTLLADGEILNNFAGVMDAYEDSDMATMTLEVTHRYRIKGAVAMDPEIIAKVVERMNRNPDSTSVVWADVTLKP